MKLQSSSFWWLRHCWNCHLLVRLVARVYHWPRESQPLMSEVTLWLTICSIVLVESIKPSKGCNHECRSSSQKLSLNNTYRISTCTQNGLWKWSRHLSYFGEYVHRQIYPLASFWKDTSTLQNTLLVGHLGFMSLRLFHQIMDLTSLHALPCILPSSHRSSPWCTFHDVHPAHTDVEAVSYSLPLVSLLLRMPKGKCFSFLAQAKLGTCPSQVLSMTPVPKWVQLSTSPQRQRHGKGTRPILHQHPSYSLSHL